MKTTAKWLWFELVLSVLFLVVFATVRVLLERDGRDFAVWEDILYWVVMLTTASWTTKVFKKLRSQHTGSEEL